MLKQPTFVLLLFVAEALVYSLNTKIMIQERHQVKILEMWSCWVHGTLHIHNNFLTVGLLVHLNRSSVSAIRTHAASIISILLNQRSYYWSLSRLLEVVSIDSRLYMFTSQEKVIFSLFEFFFSTRMILSNKITTSDFI